MSERGHAFIFTLALLVLLVTMGAGIIVILVRLRALHDTDDTERTDTERTDTESTGTYLETTENMEVGTGSGVRIVAHDHPTYGRVYVFGADDLISGIILRNELWEEALCKWLASYYEPGTDVLDIGANLGLNSLRMQQLKPISHGCVYHLFEPQHDVFTLLKLNTKSLPRVLYNFALSDKVGYVNFTQVHANVGATSVSNGTSHSSTNVMANTLDSIAFDRRISVVKMDVEGFEEQVLTGGAHTLYQHRPTIVIEIWSSRYEIVSKLLTAMGYVQIANHRDDYVFVPQNKCK